MLRDKLRFIPGYVFGFNKELEYYKLLLLEREATIQRRESTIKDREHNVKRTEELLQDRELRVAGLEREIQRYESLSHDFVKRTEELLEDRGLRVASLEASLEREIQRYERVSHDLSAVVANRFSRPSVLPFGNNSVVARTLHGFYLVVPTWNVDVAIGIIRDGIIEPHTTAVARALARPGMTVVNAGANFGYYSMLYASLVGQFGKVYAIEANIELFPYLMRSIYWAGYPNIVKLFHAAVAEKAGEQFEIVYDPQFIGGGTVQPNSPTQPTNQRAIDSLWESNPLSTQFDDNGEWRQSNINVSSKVKTASLDTLCRDASRVDILHMDIEGSEISAIRGSKSIFQRSPNMSIIMEWSPYYNSLPDKKNDVQDVITGLYANNFLIYQICHDLWDSARALPVLTLVRSLEALYSIPHGDLLVCRDLEAAASPNVFEVK
jgi:FkbM family methyltransferase